MKLKYFIDDKEIPHQRDVQLIYQSSVGFIAYGECGGAYFYHDKFICDIDTFMFVEVSLLFSAYQETASWSSSGSPDTDGILPPELDMAIVMQAYHESEFSTSKVPKQPDLRIGDQIFYIEPQGCFTKLTPVGNGIYEVKHTKSFIELIENQSIIYN